MPCDKIIPVRNVCYVEQSDLWEIDEVEDAESADRRHQMKLRMIRI